MKKIRNRNKFYGTIPELIFAIVIFIIFLCVFAIFVDERLSRQLDNVDITWEEMNK